jgi:ribose transport system permease protein
MTHTIGRDELSGKKETVRILVENRLVIIVLVLVAVLAIVRPTFIRIGNIRNMLLHMSTNGIMAIGMTIVLISGAFDLSVGSVMSLSGIIAIMLIPFFGLVISIFLAVVGGTFCGFLNGIVITKGKVNPFIATLGTMVLIKGLCLAITNSEPISPENELFGFIGWGTVAGIPNPVIVLVVVTAAGALMLRFTDVGRNVYAIGGNEFSCRLAGINVNRYKIFYFTLCAFLASIAGIIVSSRANIGSAVLGDNTPLIIIALVVLGGTSLSGGKGTVLGTILGLLVFGLIDNGMVQLDIYSYYQFIVRGTIILFVILADTLIAKRR